MNCKPTYKGVRYNSVEDLKSSIITPQQKQQAQSKFQEYVNATGKQDIEGFKKFVIQSSTSVKEILVVPKYEINKNLKNTDGTKRFASTDGKKITINPVNSSEEFFNYFEGKEGGATSQQKTKVLTKLNEQGWSTDRIKSILTTNKLINTFLILHEQDHIDNNDKDVYWKNGKDLLTDDKVDIEVRATINALEKLSKSTTQPSTSVKEFDVADKLTAIEQNFTDGQGGRQMQDKFKGKSTMDLIISGDRTRTTRAKTDIQRMAKDYGLSKISDLVGKVIRMTDKTGRQVYTRITKVAPFTQEYQNATWQKEGWVKSVTDKHVGDYPYAIEFEVVSKPTQPSTSVNELMSSSEVDDVIRKKEEDSNECNNPQ